jgi:enamine deaminase RidA (YjgF/YER057c/UK114 family)
VTDPLTGPVTEPVPPGERERVWSGGPWERTYGYCRALRVGERIVVSGCTAAADPEVLAGRDAAPQLRVALDTGLAAIRELGGDLADVVRTRMYVLDRADCDAVGAVHGEVFAAHPPAATMVLVAGLLHPDMRVEVELEAVTG